MLIIKIGGHFMEITGVYTKTVFRNENDGFTIFKFRLNKPILDCPFIEISCKGKIQSALICTPLKLTGTLTSDDYGYTFIADDAMPFSDDTLTTIEYLSSSFFEGIAEATAKKIVDITGPDIFSYIHQKDAIDNLLKIKGLTYEKIESLISTISKTKFQKDIFEYISSYGGSFRHAELLFAEYGSKTLDLLLKNPYKTGCAVELPFRICDCIAKENGTKYNDFRRIQALVFTTIQQCYLNGDMYVLLNRLFNGVNYLEKNLSAFPDFTISESAIVAAAEDMEQIIIEIESIDENPEIRFYLKKSFFDEKTVSKNIARIQSFPQKFNIDISKAVTMAEKELNIEYSPKQKECFSFLSTSGLKIITGGPGTGKSTVVNGLIYSFTKNNPDAIVKIMAPTGRAAQRVSEITSLPAGTIHRMLNILPYSKDQIDTSYNGDFPADLLIVDEASMLDTSLTALLMKSIKNTTLVIFCGDIDQLPSVGAGNVLNELIKSHKIDVVQLDTNYRQKNKSTIIENAIKTNTGKCDYISDASFEVIECDNEDEIHKTVIKNFVDNYNTYKPYDVQILSSTKKGNSGTASLNKRSQEIVNSTRDITASSNSRFKINDKVMTVRNNYDVGYFNGDIGIIKSIDDVYIKVQFIKDEINIPKSNIQDIELAYACTVHKSQGSEYDTVIISLPETPSNMLKRNLLYTAITRAKKKVVVVTQKGCLSKSVSTVKDIKRKSSLSEKIIQATGEIYGKS